MKKLRKFTVEEAKKSTDEEAEHDGMVTRTPTTSDDPKEEMKSSELREDSDGYEESSIKKAISSTILAFFQMFLISRVPREKNHGRQMVEYSRKAFVVRLKSKE